MDLSQTPNWKLYQVLCDQGKLEGGKWVVVANGRHWICDTRSEAKARFRLLESPSDNPVVLLRHGHTVELPDIVVQM